MSLKAATSGVKNIVAGSGIAVDATDPKNPVVSTTGGGGGGAPTDATYLTLSTNATLTNERVLTAGTNIAFTDNGAGSTLVVNSLADRYKTTSSTSQTIVSSGTLTFTVDANLAYIPMQEALIVYDASNHMHGSVVSYSGTSLVVGIKQKTGSGTYSSWSINLDGTPVNALTGSGATNELAYFTGAQTLGSLSTASYPNLTEVSYVKGVTSAIQTQIDNKIDGTMGAGLVPFGSDSNTLTTLPYFNYDTASNRFEVFSSLGGELITNGTFTGSATGWTLPTGWAYSSNSVSHSSNGTGALSPTTGVSTVLGEEYILSFVVSNNLAGGTVQVAVGSLTVATISANGSYSYRVVPTSTGNLTFTPSNTSRFTIDTVSMKKLQGGSIATDNLGIGGAVRSPSTTKMSMNFNHGNTTGGTTRAIEFNNAGSGTWLDFNFAGVNKSYLSASSGGEIGIWTSGANHFALYNKNTLSAYAYFTPNEFATYGIGKVQGSFLAGGLGSITSTLQSAGSFGANVNRVIASQTLDNTAYSWIANAVSVTCTGTPSASCASHVNESACAANDAHGGCSWFSGYDCSAYSYESGMGTCTTTSGCSASTASCSSAGDYSACIAQNDSYGGSCSWDNDPQSCSGFTDESTCTSYSGCTWYPETTGDCSTFNGDQATCESTSGCSWSDPDCSGTYVISSAYCDGSYDSYNCNGNFYTGECTGMYGAACTGTATCTGINDSTSCGAETGCTWSTAVNLTLPAITTCPDRHYDIVKEGSGGTVYIYPSGTDKLNNTTSHVLTADKEGIQIRPYRETASCSTLNQSACAANASCTVNYNNCSWNSGDSTCSGDVVCDGIGDQGTCESTSYFSYCSGNYVTISNWYIFGKTS